MPLFRWSVVCAMAALATAAFAQAPPLEHMDVVLKMVPDGPIASVNNEPVSDVAFRRLYIAELAQFKQVNPGAPLTDAVRMYVALRVRSQLLQREILLQAAREKKIEVAKSELAEAWDGELERLKAQYARAQVFRKHMESGGSRDTTPDELKAAVEGVKKELDEAAVLEGLGMTREEALGALEEQLLVTKMQERVVEETGASVTDADIAGWHAENRDATSVPERCHIKQVFVAKPTGREATHEALEAAKAKAELALKRIRSGELFEAVAREMTEHPGPIREEGGEIGWGPVNSLPEPLQKALAGLEPGGTTGIVETAKGYYITKLVEAEQAQELALDEVAPDIRELLENREASRAVREYCMNRNDDIRMYLALEEEIERRPELARVFGEGGFDEDAVANGGVPAPSPQR